MNGFIDTVVSTIGKVGGVSTVDCEKIEGAFVATVSCEDKSRPRVEAKVKSLRLRHPTKKIEVKYE